MAFHAFKMQGITGEQVTFDSFKGKHCLVVNVASKCGLTPQYEGLEKLQQDRSNQDFTVLGFPCNQFGAQEPGSDAEVCEFAQSRYNATFPMFSKVEVNGDGACDLYKWLKNERAQPSGTPDIAWNFTKFLVDGEGNVVERFEPRTSPEEIDDRLNQIL